MQHFFVTPDQVEKDTIWIEGTDVNHIKNVLRMKIGEQLEISDGNNQRYLCEISVLGTNMVETKIIEKCVSDTEPSSHIVLFQGLPKADKMEWIIQKSVELGVGEVVPVATKRTVVKLDDKKAKKKTERWQMISESAAKQAGRGKVPKIQKVMTFSEALEEAEMLDCVLIPYELAEGMEETRRIMAEIKKGMSIGIFIGPEGGFEREEVKKAIEEASALPITLGKRILRTETAGLTVLSILTYLLEE